MIVVVQVGCDIYKVRRILLSTFRTRMCKQNGISKIVHSIPWLSRFLVLQPSRTRRNTSTPPK